MVSTDSRAKLASNDFYNVHVVAGQHEEESTISVMDIKLRTDWG